MEHPHTNPGIRLSEEVHTALDAGAPVVALETAVVTHGLPAPHHLEVAAAMDRAIRDAGAIPALCVVDRGELWVGASAQQAERVASDPQVRKASVRDLGAAIAAGASAGLTVSATLFAAQRAGIHAFATGGIGGVHAGAAETGDISADLLQLSRSPVVTVCSGAKSVLDIPRTLEFLETAGVPVFSYGSNAFPAFYLLDSGRTAPRVNTPEEVAAIAGAQWAIGHTAGLVVGNPIPTADAIPTAEWDAWLRDATDRARHDGISGGDVTPYLLAAVAEISGGRTVEANVALLISNARLAAEIAVALSPA